MSKINQVMQIGEIQEHLHFYIEDYAYTYLKKQKGKEKAKYFLYGEREEKEQRTKLYVYGIAEKPKMEQSYFKEYYPLGFLKLKEEELILISLKGQEERITGFYVFYAPNQAMQEYLVDHREEETEKKTENRKRKFGEEEFLPMKEKWIPVKKYSKNKTEFKNEKFLLPVTGILVACVVLFAMTTANGRKKIEIFKQVIAETLSGSIAETGEEELIIEEKNVKVEETKEEELEEAAADRNEQSEEPVIYEGTAQLREENPASKEETTAEQEKKEAEEYIVKDGDTLAAICKQKYGTLSKMKEICALNNIENADYIAPGQKIYLP